jgi:hypothetical protein
MADEPAWLVPRHELICSMGIFNPSGPTVASLEASWKSGEDWSLYLVIRHTVTPRITLLAEGTGGHELDTAISEAFPQEVGETLGGGIEWLATNGRPDAVRRGLLALTRALDPNELAGRAASLLRDPDDPWLRLSAERDDPITEPDVDADSWIDAITHPVVIAGHQLFIRSAWEGALSFAQGDIGSAQARADSVTFRRRQRVLDDHAYRGAHPLVLPPGWDGVV